MKIIRFIIFCSLISSLISFLFLVNLKVAFGTPEKLKTILVNSDAYNTISGAVRENIVNTNPDLNNTNLLETLTEKVGNAGFQTISEDMINQLYSIQENKSKEIVLHYSLLKDQLPGVTLPADQAYNLADYPAFKLVFGSYYSFLAGSVLVLVLSFILHITLIGNEKRSKISWLGTNFFMTSIILAGSIFVLYYFLPSQMEHIMQLSHIENQKIARGLTLAFEEILKVQRTPYILEFAITLFVSTILISISRALRGTNHDIDQRLNNLGNIK